MEQISLLFGEESVLLTYDSAVLEPLISNRQSSTALSDVQIGEALDLPIDSAGLDELLNPGESVLIVVSDATRATASAQVVNLLVRRLIQNGIAPSAIAIIFATGIHRAVSASEKQALLTPFIVQRIRTIDHDANSSPLRSFGITKRGTAAELNRTLGEFDHVILTGGIAFHYFAGFTGGRKSVCPGLASSQTIRDTHMLALDLQNGGRRAGVSAGLLDGNAVHEECEEIAGFVRIAFSINCVVDERGYAMKIYAGDWRTAHRTACLEYLTEHSISIAEKRDLVVVGCGGLPYDINLIQAHKALEMAAHACHDGGTILLIAECRDGLGRPDFMKWFGAGSSREIARELKSGYEVNGQTAWALATKTERFNVLLHSTLTEADVRRMNMTPVHDVNHALSKVDYRSGYILPRGAAFLPVLELESLSQT